MSEWERDQGKKEWEWNWAKANKSHSYLCTVRAEWSLLPEKRPILTFNGISFASVLSFHSELSQDWQAPRKSGPTCNCRNRFAISCSAVKLFYLGTIWLAAQRPRMGLSTHWLGYFTPGDVWAIHALRTSASWHKHIQSYLRDWVHLSYSHR